MGHKLWPVPEVILTDSVRIDASFISRLMEFYQRQPEPDLSDIWKGVLSAAQGPLVSALETGNEQALKNVLENLFQSTVMGGMDVSFDPEAELKLFSRAIITLGNLLGSVPLFTPEQPSELTIDPENLVESSERLLGFPLEHPPVGRMWCVKIGDRFIPAKFVDAIVAMVWHPDRDWSSGRVLEIGAGSSYLGYLQMHRGFGGCYETIDIPTSSVIQAALMAMRFGPESVWLNGEPETANAFVKIWGTTSDPGGTYRLIFNQDSLPEMPYDVGVGYAKMIEMTLDQNGFFVSINHESDLGGQKRVFDYMKHTSLVQTRRDYFYRTGYLQELWAFK